MLKPGIYEQIINKKYDDELTSLTDKKVDTLGLDSAESSKVLANYLSELIEKGLQNISDNLKEKGEILQNQIYLTNKIISLIQEDTKNPEFESLKVKPDGKQLYAIVDKTDSIFAVNESLDVIRPDTSISQSSLFTGSNHEPVMFTELKKEIVSADKIEMLVSFIKWSGLRLIYDELKKFTESGGTLKVISTSYMGATDVKAIEELSKLNNTEIKISYDTKRTRLHAKAYVFYRENGFTTAYVGSSNLSNAAMSSGLEWNLKITKKDMSDTIDKINATFDSYWNSAEFEIYDESKKEKLITSLLAEKSINENNSGKYVFDIYPYPYQQEILDELYAERKVRGYYKNLIVAATGTGKTVISAFDYKRFRRDNPKLPCRLLFVAHREEILKQSLNTFRGILKDYNFGELFVGGCRPGSIDNLFVSIQTLNSQNLTEKTNPEFYDYIIVDEFHHAAAPTYQKLLSYYKPKILLGLTATPERMDGKNVLSYFDNRITAEIRLPEAIERKLLCPFQYFGVADSVDLSSVKWVNGGYDKKELSDAYVKDRTKAKIRANLIGQSVVKYVTDIRLVKGLGFCASVEHAKFMSDAFNEAGIPSIYLIGESSDDERKTASKKLVSGAIKFIFVVDIYNEGVDIPEVNTILFLRPTESLTVFLQQLGRGLRLAEGKECLTVLDFIGQANTKYNFESRFAALLKKSGGHSVKQQIKTGFGDLPSGCFIQLDKVSQERILENITTSLGRKSGIITHIKTFKEDTGLDLTLKNYLDYYHMDIRYLYSKHINSSFSRLCVFAGVIDDFNEHLEDQLTKAIMRFAFVDSRRFITFIREILTTDKHEFTPLETRMLYMFHYTIWQKNYSECGYSSLNESLRDVKKNPTLCKEIIEILDYNYDHIDFIDEPVDLGFDCPLDLHCRYTRDQILVAMDFYNTSAMREGVKYLPDKMIDLFFITLNKAEADYSPTTMYQDYSINEKLFHWQSQSITSEGSKNGQRYIHHKELHSNVLLFVREFKTERISGLVDVYTFLGKASYLSHEGSCPMNVIWELEDPIPAKFLKKTNKLFAD